MNTEYDIDLVERYFDNELSEGESALVDERLKTDAEFRAFFNRERALIRSIRSAGFSRDLQLLKEIERGISAADKGHQLRIQPWYFAAAAAVALFVVAALWILPPGNSPDQLFDDYFTPVSNTFAPALRGSDTPSQPEAFRYYDHGDYATAASLFDEMLGQETGPDLLLLSANAHLAAGNTRVAEQHLTTLIRDFDDYDTPAKWYLGLCYLKQGDVDKARTVLEELGQREVFYTGQAKELLQKVK
ncbi:MAG TPA: tetratricopeptide repeat protein [Cyclobacteriaceae bacterium]|nr:tetratricopeptide repeat protein [Cyclobacteriaceae bacterium]